MNDQQPADALHAKTKMPEQSGSDSASQKDRACEMCGRFDAVQVGDRFLCVDCYEGCGSCCQESNMDD